MGSVYASFDLLPQRLELVDVAASRKQLIAALPTATHVQSDRKRRLAVVDVRLAEPTPIELSSNTCSCQVKVHDD